jgi:hypothetical protein
MRVALLFTLLATSSAQKAAVVEESHECPVIDWLKKHGADAFDTLLECKNVPEAWKAFKESGCHAKTGMMDKVSMALWEAITILDHLNGTIPDMVKHSDLAAKVKDDVAKRLIKSSDESLVNWCEHDQCEDMSKKIQAAFSPCYASLTCNFMTSVLPFGECKDVFSKYMSDVMNLYMGSMCNYEDQAGGKYYCAQLNSVLMFRDFDCFVEMKQTSGALAKCTPRCVELWQGTEKKLPKCSKQLLNTNQEMYKAVLTLMEDMSKYSKHPIPTKNLPKTIPNYDDICGHSPSTITV